MIQVHFTLNSDELQKIINDSCAKITEARLIHEFHEVGLSSQRKRSILNDVYELWLESEYEDNVQGSTLNQTIRGFKNHIIPSFGEMDIKEIKPDHCQS